MDANAGTIEKNAFGNGSEGMGRGDGVLRNRVHKQVLLNFIKKTGIYL